MKTYVLYHSNCYDGFGAAFAAWCKFAGDATYIPCTYGTPPPAMEPNSKVYILDFSYPRADMIELMLRYDVTVIDHHKTAKEELKGLPNTIFDMSSSGAVLAWAFFHSEEDVPQLLYYIQDRDLWKFELPMSREVAAALQLYPFDFDKWEILLRRKERAITQLQQEGIIALRYKEQCVDIIARRAKLENFAGHVVPVVNATSFFSEVGEKLLELFPEALFSVYWFVNDKHQIQYGFRSRPDFDVSVVAKQLKGGGHPQAAGAQFPWGDQHLEYVD